MEFCINPKTNRPIRIGSRTHRQLITDAINRIDQRDTSLVYDGDENTEPEIDKFDKTLQYLTIYNGKIIARYKKIKTEQLLKHIIKIIPNVIDSYLGLIDDVDDNETLRNKLIQCLHSKLLE
jgi:hypothetical protein